MTHSQRVDREQVESDYWFGRLRGRLLQEVLWADDQVAAIPYRLSAKGLMACVERQQLVHAGVDDLYPHDQ